MSTRYWVLVLGIVFVVIVGRFLFGQSSLSISPGGLLSQCGVSVAKELKFCNVSNDPANPDGMYVSANGAAYFRVSATATGGVTSFNTRTGAVVPAANDYSYSQLSAPPTNITCNTATLSTGATGKFVATGCTIN